MNFCKKHLVLVFLSCLSMKQQQHKKMFIGSDKESKYKALFAAISVIAIALHLHMSLIVKVLFHTDDPRLKLPWAQMSVKFSLGLQIAKFALGLFLLMDDSLAKSQICAGFTGAIAVIAIYFLLNDPMPESHLVFFLEACEAAMFIANAIGAFTEFVFLFFFFACLR